MHLQNHLVEKHLLAPIGNIFFCSQLGNVAGATGKTWGHWQDMGLWYFKMQKRLFLEMAFVFCKREKAEVLQTLSFFPFTGLFHFKKMEITTR